MKYDVFGTDLPYGPFGDRRRQVKSEKMKEIIDYEDRESCECDELTAIGKGTVEEFEPEDYIVISYTAKCDDCGKQHKRKEEYDFVDEVD